MLRRIWAVIQKEFIQTLRDRRTLMIQLLLPMANLFLFGYAINTNVDHIATAVADQSLDRASRAYVEAMTASGFFDVVAYVDDRAKVVALIDAGVVRAGIVIPPDFDVQVARGDAQALFLADGTDLMTSQSAFNAANTIAQVHAVDLVLEKVLKAGLPLAANDLQPLDARLRILYNPNLEDLWFIIPGMVAMLMQTQTISLTAAAVVRERETGTIEQLLVTPIRPLELMVGKVAPNIVIALVNMLTILGVGIWWFKVPFEGDFSLFMWLAFVYLFSGLGLGLLISTISSNQRQAAQVVGLMLLMGLVLGGFIFPRYAMPPVVRWAGYLFPMTFFIPIVRGIMTKGVGVSYLMPQIGALVFYVVTIMLLASRAFKQGLD